MSPLSSSAARPSGVAAEPFLRPGDPIGAWSVEALVATGGQAQVFRARGSGDKTVALKVFAQGFFASTAAERVARELAAGRRLSHRNVLVAEDAGRHQGYDYLVLPLCIGRTVGDLLEEAPPSTGEALAMVIDIARGLEHCHGKGVVHRDVSPGNVLVGEDGAARLIDFGLAAIDGLPEPQAAAGVIGTRGYAAPELRAEVPATPALDSYGLGALAHRLFDSAELPQSAQDLISECRADDPLRRPTDLRGWATALTAALGVDPQPLTVVAGPPPTPRPPRARQVDPLNPSPRFGEMLAEQGLSLALLVPRAERLVLISGGERVSSFVRKVGAGIAIGGGPGAFAMCRDTDTLVFVDAMPDGERSRDGHDAVFVPQVTYFTSAIEATDVVLIDVKDPPLLASGVFSSVVRPAVDASFIPIWKPSFISALAPETRCGLSGIAADAAGLRYATCFSTSDRADGWRDAPNDGVVVDVHSGETLVDGLARPLAPRLAHGSLWVLESGSGHLGRVDLARNTYDRVAELPGAPTGLSVVDGCAFVSMSRSASHGPCGVAVVDLADGSMPAHAWFGEPLSEIAGVLALPGCRRPMAIGFSTEELRHTVAIGEPEWMARDAR